MSRHRTIVAGLLFAALAGCEFIPGTPAYQDAKARDAVAQILIDPSSAQFRNIQTRHDVVCGEANGKNRMGAYVGFVRFYVETSNWTAVLDPQFDPQELSLARRLCSSLTGYDSASCRRQIDEEAKQALQSRFDRFWIERCEADRAPDARLPFDPTRPYDENIAENITMENETDAANVATTDIMIDDNMIMHPPYDDEAFVDGDGNPVRPRGGNEISPAAPSSQTTNQYDDVRLD